MKKNYLKKLLKYISSVYSLDKKIKGLKDHRKNIKISTSAISFVLLLGFMLKIRSFNQLDDWLENEDFIKLVSKKVRLPRIDVIRDSLKTFDIPKLVKLHDEIILETKNNKLFKNGTIDGYKVIAFDGVEMFESTKKSCPCCLTRVINDVTHYFHRSVVAAYVGSDPCLVIGQEMLKPKKDSSNKDEGELTAAKRLLDSLNKKFKNFADVVVYDAIACNAPWFNHVKSFKLDAVVRVKDPRLNIVKDAFKLFKSKGADKIWETNSSKNKMTKVSAWEGYVDMKGLEDKIRFVKFVEEIIDKRTGEIAKSSEIWIVTNSKDIPLATLLKIIHARWNIENNVFRQLKVQWHMDHCFIHDEIGLEAALLFMLIAFNLMQLFFFKRLKGFRERGLLQVEVIERIIKEMIVYDCNGKYFLSTA